ncbi:4'-phosphopantetheinyl transferase superfamily protein [Psychrobacter sp. B38]|uniref:4'-phosphopantetheinyl transferase family protein n=1 Tax=Psychrobacter sp. B38 TaxID=3143538 RepID=UPI003210971E
MLKQLLNQLTIIDTLNESAFPYRLINSGYYVCFSHTSAHKKNSVSKHAAQTINKLMSSEVAVVISGHRPAGIDIESNNVVWKVAKRFYSNNELAAICTLPNTQRDLIATLLWQIKESFIKIHQYTLAQGLGIDYAYLIADLVSSIEAPLSPTIISDPKSHYRITVLSDQQTVVVF